VDRGLLPRRGAAELHSSPESRDVKHASEVGLFFEPSSLTSSELRVDQDELWADGLGHAEGEGSSLTGCLGRLIQTSAQSADESFGTWVRHPEIRKAPRYLVEVTGSSCDAPQRGSHPRNGPLFGPGSDTRQVGRWPLAKRDARHRPLPDHRVALRGLRKARSCR
jgi:hypothetical protein